MAAEAVRNAVRRIPDERLVPFAREVRHSIRSLYTGSAADYADRLPDGTVENPPSLAHVGSGEGAQAFGWGLYASTVRGIAEDYAQKDRIDKLHGKTYGGVAGLGGYSRKLPLAYTVEYTGSEAMPESVRRELEHSGVTSVDDIINNREESIIEYSDDPDNDIENDHVLKWLKRHRGDITITPPKVSENVYEQTFFTDRAPGDESHLLNWYEPVSEENGERIANRLNEERVSGDDHRMFKWENGRMLEGFYDFRRDEAGNVVDGSDERIFYDVGTSFEAIDASELYDSLTQMLGSQRAASEFLARAGIDGVKYPVRTMSGAPKSGDGARFNYVSFRDDNIRVDHKWTDGEPRYSVTQGRGDATDPQREYDEVVARFTNEDGTRKPGWMETPNGEPTNLTERQWVQVRTPAFKAWFGDWEGDPENASMAMDENGEPRVVYHGTPNDFTAFRRDFLGSTTRGAGTEWGFYFSDSEDLARAVVEDYSGREAKVIEGYLNIRNPLRVDLKDYDGDLDAALEQLQDSDYDGAVISGLVDHGIESENFLVLDGKQVKSATDNAGAFDASDPDIRHSVVRGATSGVKEALWRIADGEDHGVIHNAEYGDIEYPLGRTGRRGMGLAHIVESRMAKDGATLDEAIDVAIKVASAAESGRTTTERYNTKHLDKDGVRAIVAFMPDGSRIITGYEISADGRGGANRRSPRPESRPHVSLEGIVAALKSKLAGSPTPDIVAQSAPSSQVPDADGFVRDAVMGMLAAAGDGKGAADGADGEGERPKPERASVRRGGSSVRIDDLAIGTLAQRILAGKEPTVDDAGKFLAGFGLSRTVNAADALDRARRIAEANRERLKGEVERANPEVIGTLARANLADSMQSAMDSLVKGTAQAIDPEIGMRLKDAVAARDRRALMAAKGFTAAEMMAKLPVNLAEAVMSVAELERTPEEMARREEERKRREEEKEKAKENAETTADADGYTPATDEIEPTDEQKRMVAELLDRAKFANEQAAREEERRKADAEFLGGRPPPSGESRPHRPE